MMVSLYYVIQEMHSFLMRPAKYFYEKPLTKYLDSKTVLIYRPHPVWVNTICTKPCTDRGKKSKTGTGSIKPVSRSIRPVTGGKNPVTGSIMTATCIIRPVTGSIRPVTGSIRPVTGTVPYHYIDCVCWLAEQLRVKPTSLSGRSPRPAPTPTGPSSIQALFHL